jgi:hypothetical protein
MQKMLPLISKGRANRAQERDRVTRACFLQKCNESVSARYMNVFDFESVKSVLLMEAPLLLAPSQPPVAGGRVALPSY